MHFSFEKNKLAQKIFSYCNDVEVDGDLGLAFLGIFVEGSNITCSQTCLMRPRFSNMGVPCTVEDASDLRSNIYLSSNLMDSYLLFCCKDRKIDNEQVWMFNCSMFNITGKVPVKQFSGQEEAQRWNLPADLLKRRLFVAVVHQDTPAHWMLLVVLRKECTMMCYLLNPLGATHRKVAAEMRALFEGFVESFMANVGDGGMKFLNFEWPQSKAMLQGNCFDCGPCCLLMAEDIFTLGPNHCESILSPGDRNEAWAKSTPKFIRNILMQYMILHR